MSQLLSFEALFVLFLYSNEIKVLLPKLPIDETVLFGAVSMGVGAWLLTRKGLYLPGLVIVGTAFLFVAFALISYGWTPSKILIKQRLGYLLIFNMWCVIGGALIIASSRARTLRFLCLVLLMALFVAAAGLRVYLIYGNFRTLDMWDELGLQPHLSELGLYGRRRGCGRHGDRPLQPVHELEAAGIAGLLLPCAPPFCSWAVRVRHCLASAWPGWW